MYVAPEVLSGNYNEKVDEWSAGIVLYTMLTGYPPFQSKNPKELLKMIKSGVYNKDINEYGILSKDAKDLISALLTLDPNARITAQEALDHPWISKKSKKSDKNKVKINEEKHKLMTKANANDPNKNEEEKEITVTKTLQLYKMEDTEKFQENVLKKMIHFIKEEEEKKELYFFSILQEEQSFSNQMELKKNCQIGTGGFGTVWKAVDSLEDCYAIKIFLEKDNKDLAQNDLDSFKEMITELKNLLTLKGTENIMSITGIASNITKKRSILGIVQNLMDSDLKTYLRNNPDITLETKLLIAIQISKGLKAIHYRGFSHNDIKLGNVLVNWKNEIVPVAKLSDFGTLIRGGEPDKAWTLDYCAPERLLNNLLEEESPLKTNTKAHSFKQSDIWSLGIAFYQLFFSRNKYAISFPWKMTASRLLSTIEKDGEEGVLLKKELESIIMKERKQRNEYFANKEKSEATEIFENLTKVVNECCQVNAENRPKIEEILQRLKENENLLKGTKKANK